ncbi:MAG: baseplate J/gp47 family protein, partial [Deltaproteobacteria bacterium]|nr:baseplate J/gp47 family protein [Deltaproteobacteria bacterium]
MSYPWTSYDEDLLTILADYRNRDDGRPTHKGTDTYSMAAIKASLSQDLQSKIKWVKNQAWADTADSENLERHAALRTNIYRRPPTGASGPVHLSGEPGAEFEAGLAATDETGLEYETTEGGTVGGDGLAEVQARAVSTGRATRLVVGEILTLASPPPGLEAEAQVTEDWQGGSDRESDAELLARHLWLLRHPPAGGNRFDYITWAMEVPGVHAAFHFPRRRGLGTADTVILAAPDDLLPGQALIDAAQA